MPSNIKPIKVWGVGGPNPAKVHIIIAELGLPSEAVPIPFSDVKNPEYLSINPNGRIPSMHDPNSGITIWESGAIVEYLIDTYDKDHRLSFPQGTPEYWLARQWLYYQTTGQGPYFGQAVWFKKFHHEQIPSAFDRYVKEVHRVSSVLEGHLSKQKEAHGASGDGPFLVGNKFSYADLAFYTWHIIVASILGKETFDVDKFPLVSQWLGKMGERKTIKEVMASISKG